MSKEMKTVLDCIFTIVFECSQSQKESVCNSIYREILDNFAIYLIADSFESKKILKAIMQLSTIERVIVAFHFVLELDLNEISVIIRSPLESVYSQKSKAIRKIRLWLSVA